MLVNILMLITSGILLYMLFKPIENPYRKKTILYEQINEINSFTEFDEVKAIIHNVNYGEEKSNV